MELPPQERYKFENIPLAGLWYGKSKPHVPPFLKHFINELFNLADGNNFNNETCELVSLVCRIQSVIPHLPTKALLLNIKQHNGKFGCSTCKQPGRYSHSDWQNNTCKAVYWPSGTVAVRTAQETRMFGRIGEATEAPQCLALKEKMCFVNWLTFQTIIIYLLTGCIVFAKASRKYSYSNGGSILSMLQIHTVC